MTLNRNNRQKARLAFFGDNGDLGTSKYSTCSSTSEPESESTQESGRYRDRAVLVENVQHTVANPTPSYRLLRSFLCMNRTPIVDRNSSNPTIGVRFNGRRLHGCTSFPEMGKAFYRDMTPVFAIIPSQFRDGFGCRSNVSLSQQANPNVGANEPHS